MKAIVASLFIFLGLSTLSAQEKELYFVSVETSFLRSGPGTNYNVVAELTKGMQVLLISEDFGEFWTVQYKTLNGFINRDDILALPKQFIVEEKTVIKEVKKEVEVEYEVVNSGSNRNNYNGNNAVAEKYKDWDTTEYETGETPECLSIVPEFDYSLDNYLKVNSVGSNTEAVVKLIKIDNPNGEELTYRIAYIQNGDNHYLRNVPAGKYYLKIAYGSDWRETTEGGNCYGRFVQNAQYEKGGDIVDFTPVKTTNGIDVPSYELALDVSHSGNNNSLETDDISEQEFNNN